MDFLILFHSDLITAAATLILMFILFTTVLVEFVALSNILITVVTLHWKTYTIDHPLNVRKLTG